MAKQHRHERVVDMLAEKLDHDLEILLNWATTEGRMLFHKELTTEELLQRWLIPEIRQKTAQREFDEGGQSAVDRYIKRMTKLQEKQNA